MGPHEFNKNTIILNPNLQKSYRVRVVFTNDARYFLLFLDDYSRFTWLYILHSKDQVCSNFVRFKILLRNSLASQSRHFKLIMELNLKFLLLFSVLMAFLIASHAHIPHNKMVGLRGRFATSQKPISPF